MADPRSTPSKAEASSREASDSTIGPGPGSSMSNRSSILPPPSSTPQPRKASMSYREASGTLSYIPSEIDASGVSATEYSSDDDADIDQRHHLGTGRGVPAQSRPGMNRARAGTQGSLRWTDVSQSSRVPSTAGTGAAKGKRRASAAGRGERDAGSGQRDFGSSKGRRQSRDRIPIPDGDEEDEDEDGRNGRFGPLDGEDDEVERIDRGEQLVRRRMKARQRELAARKKAEKEKERQQQLARQQAQQAGSGNAPLSPRIRPLSRQGAQSPTQQLDREGRPTHINLPAPDFSSLAVTSPVGPTSPGLRMPINYPSPHSHIRRPSARASVVDPMAGGATRRASAASTGNYSSTVAAPQPVRASGTPLTPLHAHPVDIFSENALSEGETVSSLRGERSAHPDEHDEGDEGRDTVGNLAREVGPARSDLEGGFTLDEAIDGQDGDDVEANEGLDGQNDEDEDHSGDTGEDSSDGDVEYTLKDRQDAINIEHPFGLPIWKPALYKKSRTVTRNAESALHSIPSAAAERHLLPANLLWTAFAGFWLSLICFFFALVINLLPLGGSKYARVIWELAGYLFWPFGKYVEVEVDPLSKERLSTSPGETQAGFDNNAASQEANADSYENSFTPVAARFPHDHKHTVPFNSKPSSHSLDLSRHDTIRPGDTLGAYQAMDDQNRSSGSGSSSGGAVHDEQRQNDRRSEDADSQKGYGTMKSVEEGNMINYSEAERIRQETDIYGYVQDDEGRDVGQAGRIVGTIAYGIVFWLFVAPLMGIACLACWGLVFPIPMAKLNWVLLKNLGQRPLALRFRSAPRVDASTYSRSDEMAPLLGHKRSILQQLKVGEPAPRTAKQSSDGQLVRRSRILVCTYRAMGLQYYKYTVGGVNILFINTLPFVFFTIFDFFFIEPYVERHHIKTGLLALISSKVSMFVFALGSVIPLSYFIGMAVASISAQSSIGMGAVINATFGSIIEIILYAIALTQDKARLVEGSIIGSILAGVLLMPGVSMCSGAMRRKEQRFNARSAGVTSTMLIMAIIGILTPTLFYQIYGTFQLTCNGCPVDNLPGETWTCKRCFYEHVPPATDPFYQENVKGLMYTCTIVLVLSYGIGLWFSLRTHASQIWQNAQSNAALASGHQAAATSAGTTNAGQAGAAGVNVSATNASGQQIAIGTVPVSNFSSGQRASVYKRILPAGVLQQLIPSSHRVSSGQSQTVRSNQSRATILSDGRGESGEAANNALPPLNLPETMSTEEYERALGLPSSALPSHARTKTLTSQGGHSTIGTGHASSAARRSGLLTPHEHQRQQSHHQSEAHGAGEEAEHGPGGHDAPSWTRGTSLAVLLSCTVLYAIIAEILVDAVDVVLEGSGLDLKLLGVTLFALVPNATEFMNAMSFAINGNIALSMEIGSAYALQVCLIQIPAMVVFSAFYQARHGHDNDINSTFTLIFPRWDVIAIIFSIFLLTYTYIESRSNYFRGSLCVLSYVVLISGFVFAPTTGDPEDPVEDHPATLLYRAIGFGGLQPGLPPVPLMTQVHALFNSLWTR